MKFTFKSSVQWTGNKTGKIYSLGKPELQISTPPEFKGPPGYWSPEEFFLASINSCIMTTFLYFVDKFSTSFLSYTSEIEGEVSLADGKLVFSSVTVHPLIEVEDESEKKKNMQAIEKAKKYCLISSSVGVDITLLPKVEIKKD